ncbi:MAG: hypothetical protein HC767_04510 [Akkermansiaceae bacterium]|nr:hypothetical protein [Akkermansiaceae bacterium]
MLSLTWVTIQRHQRRVAELDGLVSGWRLACFSERVGPLPDHGAASPAISPRLQAKVDKKPQMANAIMIKTQVQLPDDLYYTAKAIAEQREWSLAEVLRRGIEHMALLYPTKPHCADWKLPVLESERFRSDFDQLDLKALAEADEIPDRLL